MFKKTFLLAGLSAIVLSSCVTIKQNSVTTQDKALHNIEANGKLYAAVWQQNAAEYQALCAQAFNAATMHLDQVLKQTHDKPLAIVTDIDETFLDNSPYAVQMAREGKSFSDATWTQWTAKAEAKPLLGSQAFFQYAASKGVTIFYITNRKEADKEATIKNLQKYDYPFADQHHVIVRTNESGKQNRRDKVSETHYIAMLLGDNLSDFSTDFDKKSQQQRLDNVKSNQSLFGTKYIVFPNSGYGDWEGALMDYRYDYTKEQKDRIYNQSVRGF